MLLYAHRDHNDYNEQGAKDSHLDFHTSPDLCVTVSSVLLYVHKDHKDYSVLYNDVQVLCCFTSTETIMTIMDRESRTATSTFTQVLSYEFITTLQKKNISGKI